MVENLIPNRQYQKTQREAGFNQVCGVAGCKRPTAINIKDKHVTRCNEHYSRDLSVYQTKVKIPESSTKFTAESHIMKALHKIDMLQKPNETKREYSDRCRATYLKTMGGLLPESIKTQCGD